MTTGPSAEIIRTASPSPADWPLWAAVVGVSGDGYAWEEREPDADGGWSAPTLGARTSGQCGVAMPLADAYAYPAGTLVRLDRVAVSDGTSRVFIVAPRVCGFWATIIGASDDGINRWTYTFVGQQKTATGYGGWGNDATLPDGWARNTLENMNAAEGTLGNGVDAGHLDADAFTFTVQRCPDDAIVWVRPVRTGETVEYWFVYANGVDGECD